MSSKSTCSIKVQRYKNLQKTLTKISFNKHAKASGFKKRKEKKITGKVMLIAFIYMAMKGKNTVQQWAEQIGLITGETVSRQGLWKRITEVFVDFLVRILMEAIDEKIERSSKQLKRTKLLKKYKRVLLQDSTVIALPSWLSIFYPGNVTNGKKKSQLKIQVVYDLLNNRYVYFAITPYTKNDQSQANEIVSIAEKGDIVIRDLGYFAMKTFDKMNVHDIRFISRLRYGVNIYDAETEKKIDLLKVLRKKRFIDRWVLIGEKERVLVRLVGLHLTQQQAGERKRKAVQDRDRRLNHSKKYYELLEYNLFITSESENVFTPKQIAQIYQFRWRIEIIFKCWKSHFNLQKLIPESYSLTKVRAEAIIYMILIFIVLIVVPLINIIEKRTENIEDGYISLCKFCKYTADNIKEILEMDENEIISQILYNCRYDKRSDRLNFIQKLNLS